MKSLKNNNISRISQISQIGIMSLLLTLALFTIHYSLLPITYALTPTPTLKPTTVPSKTTVPTNSAEIEKIQKIKDIVASKVAELSLVEKRGIIGKIKESSNTRLVIQDIKGNVRNIDIDELTKFSLGSKKTNESELGISDLEKDTYYSFVGLYNKDTERLLSRSITKIFTLPIFFEGAIFEINSDDYQIKVVSSKGEKKTIDIQNSTKTSLSTVDGELTKSGFSKMNVNERILVVGFEDLKDKTLISAKRLIHFKETPPSKQMQQFISSDIQIATPTEAEE